MALTDDLLAFWALDEASGDAIDAHASYDGLEAGMPGAASGQVSGCRTFDGTDDGFKTGTLSLGSKNVLTLAFWMYSASFDNSDDPAFEYGAPYWSSRGFIVDPNHSGGSFFVGTGGTSDGAEGRYFTRPSTGAWHHYVICFDRTDAYGIKESACYLDGSLISFTGTYSDASVAGSNFNDTTLSFACRNVASLFAAISLDEVGLWTRELTSGEVATLYSGSPYPFDSGGGIIAQPIQALLLGGIGGQL